MGLVGRVYRETVVKRPERLELVVVVVSAKTDNMEETVLTASKSSNDVAGVIF